MIVGTYTIADNIILKRYASYAYILLLTAYIIFNWIY
jgi:hypothetical protein